MAGARVIGVVSGTPEAPRIAYLKQSARIPDEVIANLGELQPTHVFRFSAQCEESRCTHFDGSRCGLGQRINEMLEPVVDALPPCTIRPTCRWHAEQGPGICRRCPQVVTMIPRSDTNPLSRAARPPEAAGSPP
jgi:hypothetical protein